VANPAFNYGAAPTEGAVLTWSDQTYIVLKASAGRLKSGTLFGEILWRTQCPDCNAEHDFRTGLERKWLPRRCAPCNGDSDLDKMERKAYSREAWGAAMKAARERKAAEKKLADQREAAKMIGRLPGESQADRRARRDREKEAYDQAKARRELLGE
jgi:hypothetical protein